MGEVPLYRQANRDKAGPSQNSPLQAPPRQTLQAPPPAAPEGACDEEVWTRGGLPGGIRGRSSENSNGPASGAKGPARFEAGSCAASRKVNSFSLRAEAGQV